MSSEPTPTRRRRWPLALAAIALLLVGLRAALPWALAEALERVLSGLLATRVEIGNVDLSLHEANFVVENAALYGVPGGAELARASRIHLDIDLGALLQRRLAAERLSIEAPVLLVAYDDEGRLNWAGVAASADEEAKPEEAPAPSFQIRIDRAELGAGVLRLVDEAPDGLPDLRLGIGAFALEGAEIGRPEPGAPLRWALAGVEATEWTLGVTPEGADALDFAIRASAGPTGPEGQMPLELEIRRENGGQLRVEGEAHPAPLELAARLSWERLSSRALIPLVTAGDARVERGTSSGELEVSFTLADDPKRGLTLRGRATHRDLALAIEGLIPARVEVARVTGELRELHLPIPAEPVEPAPPVLVHVASLEVEEPAIEATLPEEAPPAATEPGERDDEGGGLDLRVDAFALRGGRVRWHDLALGADHEQTLSGIEIETTGVRSTPAAAERVRLVVGSLGSDPLRLEGSWAPEAADLRYRATRIDLAPWNPLIVRASDYSVSRGRLSLKGRLRLEGEDYQAPTDLTLHGLQAKSERDAFQQTFGMSLPAAIRLLSDPAGNIRLKLPVAGHLTEGAGLDLVDTVNHALREAIMNALVNVLAAPTDLAGFLFRRVGEVAFLGIGEAAFRPGEAEFDLDARIAFASAARFVKTSRGARLELVPVVVRDDLHALGVATRQKNVVRSLVTAGKDLLGVGEKLDPESRRRLEDLARARLDAAERQVREEGGLAAKRIVRKKWDGKPSDGVPRVLLRLQLAKKKLF